MTSRTSVNFYTTVSATFCCRQQLHPVCANTDNAQTFREQASGRRYSSQSTSSKNTQGCQLIFRIRSQYILHLLFNAKLSDFRNSVAFWKVPSLGPFVLLVGATCSAMRQSGQSRSTGRSTALSVTLSTKNLTQTDLGSNPHLRCSGGDWPHKQRRWGFIWITSSHLTENIHTLHHKDL
jgi:hypothetical protein